MSEKSLEEYTEKMRERYGRMRGREARGVLIDEYVEVSGWSRKHANKVLLGHKRKSGNRGRRGAPQRYGEEEVRALKECWLAMDQPCGKRMADMLEDWVGYLEVRKEVREALAGISAASIDRLLGAFKVSSGRKQRPPKPASGVKALVEVRAESWETAEPGWTEVDTVAHCDGDMGGDFIWTLTSVDVASGWSEVRPVWNRGQYACVQALESISEAQPFNLLGVDSDNGGEFLNWHLYGWLKERGIEQTRSRPYRKNDQAYVEQKNYTHVRQFLGYERLEHKELVEDLEGLLREWSLWKNLFCVTMKQKSKWREGSRQVRRHDKRSYTPARRLMASGALNPEQKRGLEEQLAANNPFEMKARIRAMEDAFWRKRKRLYKEREAEALALLRPSSLRFEGRSKATKKQPTKRTASVADL